MEKLADLVFFNWLSWVKFSNLKKYITSFTHFIIYNGLRGKFKIAE